MFRPDTGGIAGRGRSGSLDLGRSLPRDPGAESAAPDDGVGAEFVAHRIHRLVDLVVGRIGTAAKEIALKDLAGLDQILGADADQAERAAVGLAVEQRLWRPEHLVGRLRGGLQVAGACDGAEVGGLELQGRYRLSSYAAPPPRQAATGSGVVAPGRICPRRE